MSAASGDGEVSAPIVASGVLKETILYDSCNATLAFPTAHNFSLRLEIRMLQCSA